MKEWIPEKDFKNAHFTYNKEKNISEKAISANFNKDKKIKKYNFPSLSEVISKQKNKEPSQEIKQNNEKEILKKSEKDHLKDLLNLLVQSNLQNSAHILRKWYWNQQELKSIFIILRSLNKEVLISLFNIFTLKERRQFVDIYKKNYKINYTEILLARKKFISSLQELS
jgi:hypothetical protein